MVEERFHEWLAKAGAIEDPFEQAFFVMVQLPCQHMTRAEAQRHLITRARECVDKRERERFTEIAEAELLSVRESDFARYQARPSEYYAWKRAWFE